MSRQEEVLKASLITPTGESYPTLPKGFEKIITSPSVMSPTGPAWFGPFTSFSYFLRLCHPQKCSQQVAILILTSNFLQGHMTLGGPLGVVSLSWLFYLGCFLQPKSAKEQFGIHISLDYIAERGKPRAQKKRVPLSLSGEMSLSLRVCGVRWNIYTWRWVGKGWRVAWAEEVPSFLGKWLGADRMKGKRGKTP